ncbi:MAG: hypothetical protein AAGJ31_04810, partial [Verrucomicrobiota bacterium]
RSQMSLEAEISVELEVADTAGLGRKARPGAVAAVNVLAGSQLADPTVTRPPAISSYGAGNTAIRTEHWRYIRYEDGSEELYDHRHDPDEWTNLANDPEFRDVKKELAAMIPTEQHPGLKVHDWFDQHQR